MPVLVALVGEAGDVGVDLGLQRRGQHPAGALADDLVDQRRRRRRGIGGVVTVGGIRDYGEHGTYLPDQRCRAGLAWNLHSVTREGTPLPEPIHRFQALLRQIISGTTYLTVARYCSHSPSPVSRVRPYPKGPNVRRWRSTVLAVSNTSPRYRAARRHRLARFHLRERTQCGPRFPRGGKINPV